MDLTAKLEGFLPDVTQVLRRFPVAVLAAVMLCGNQLYHSNSYFLEAPVFQTIVVAVFFAGGAGHLFAEGWKLSHVANVSIAAAVGFFAASLFHFGNWFHAAPLFFFGGIVLALMVAPYLRGGVKQGAVWLFNLRLALAIGFALVVGVVFGLGLSAVVAGLKFLLNIDFGHETYQRIWTVAVTLVGPVYGLSLVPKNLDEEIDLAAHHGSLLERGVSILVNYVMVPLALVYAAILHAYAVKIAFLQSLPKGEIGLIVSLFAVGGTVTWLVGWPWREKGTVLLRWFVRGWFWLLPVPAVLLAIAIWRRVADYGVTPDRYGIALVAVWTVIVFGYLVWRRNRADMRVIVGSAAALLLVGSFGPFGAYSTTATSQMARLQVALEKAGVLKNGKVVSALPVLTNSVRSDIRSMVDTIAAAGGLSRLATWYDTPPRLEVAGNNAWSVSSDVAASLGARGYEYSGGTSLLVKPSNPIKVFYLAPIQLLDHTWPGSTRLVGPYTMKQNVLSFASTKGVQVAVADRMLEVSTDLRKSTITFDKLFDAIAVEGEKALSNQHMPVIEVDANFALLVTSASCGKADKNEIYEMQFWLVLRE